jgi:putative SOS response-associated peptidase YedK
MCGRFTNHLTWAQIKQLYDITAEDAPGGNIGPRLNIAPTAQVHFCAAPEGERQLMVGRWGLAPGWVKDKAKLSFSMFNARGEEAHEKPTWKRPLAKQRCLIPATGFYEWRKNADGSKTPFFIYMPERTPFSFAGLWDYNTHLDIVSCSILTLPPEGIMTKLHDRMPVILKYDAWDDWIDVSNGTEVAQQLMYENHALDLQAYEVGKAVGNSRYHGEDAADPVEGGEQL